MSWVKVDDKFPRHPKVCALPAAAAALWLSACCWASEYKTDGFLPASVVATLPWYTAKAVPALVAGGLWEETEGGWHIHDFTRYNPSSADREEMKRGWRERQTKKRVTQASRRDIPVSHASVREGEGDLLLGRGAESSSSPAPISSVLPSVVIPPAGEQGGKGLYPQLTNQSTRPAGPSDYVRPGEPCSDECDGLFHHPDFDPGTNRRAPMVPCPRRETR